MDQPTDPQEQPEEASQPTPSDGAGQFTQRIRHQQISARVPEQVGRGVFASSALVLNGPHEFVIDFVQTVTRPQQVVQRVVLPPSILSSTADALQRNIDVFVQRFGELPAPPPPAPPARPPSVEEVYEHLKLPDELASGAYANTVMITHGPTEFCFDFITSFYPRSTVAARVYMAAPQAPRLLKTLRHSFEQFRKRLAQQSPGAQGSAPPDRRDGPDPPP